ncbi:coiled-coil domain-containing protein, partial [Endozoicomonas numazuensis]|uniref:hypothetical protein n=1 Tax=Endozoicomonas numazuensis TaxID=1137799 RepID=UPI000555FBDC
MTNARPNALSLAVAVAISSSIIGTQALADRKLQTKSVDIPSEGHQEFTQSEVMVKPTLGDDQQPIQNSYTTTYPDQGPARAGYHVPSEGFTDVLSGVDGGVSSVDLFDTGDDDVAQKYTKVLKVGDEGVFRFTHNLEENELVIEVRSGMTEHDTVQAVRAQLADNNQLEPLSKISNPAQLAGVLKGANGRAGNLGAGDNYVALATIEVDEVEINGRTFMRLISSGDQPPELQRLGQSLFVNDEVLFAAATSAYTQVHVIGEALQQEALNDLLANQKPVGYVVHVEDETKAYPVPTDYPRLEVRQAPGDIIVFHGQKLNPTDVAFVEGLFNLREKIEGDHPVPALTTQIKKDKVKSYQYVIRSAQMELLEEFAAELAADHDADLDDTKLYILAYCEYLQQALSSANSDGEDEFEFTRTHIDVTSWAITPTWMKVQLAKYFSFKPTLAALLANQHFIQKLMPVVTRVAATAYRDSEEFAIKVIDDMAKQLLEMENELAELQAKEGELAQLRNQLQRATERANASDEEKLRAQQLKQQVENELDQVRRELEQQKNQVEELQQEAERIPQLEEQVRVARAEATKARNTQLAAELGIENWDDTQALEEQARIIKEKVTEINQLVREAGQRSEREAKARNAALAQTLGMDPFAEETTLAEQNEAIETKLQELNQQPDALAKQRNAQLAQQLGIDDFDGDAALDQQNDVIQVKLRELGQQPEAQVKARNAALAQTLGMDPFAEKTTLVEQNEAIEAKLQELNQQPDALAKQRNAQLAQQLGIVDFDGDA